LISHNGDREVTIGMRAKLYSGGGEGMLHSSVAAPHASCGAGSPPFRLFRKLMTKIAVAMISSSVPREEARLNYSQP
jgi:hypothetical protein